MRKVSEEILRLKLDLKGREETILAKKRLG